MFAPAPLRAGAGWLPALPGRAGNALTWRAQPSHRRQEAPKHAPALFGDPHTCGPILDDLQVLEGEPIQLANVKLGLQRPFARSTFRTGVIDAYGRYRSVDCWRHSSD